MKIIHLTEQMPDEDVERLGGTMLESSAYDTVITEDADVYKPDGTPLIKFRKGVIPVEMCLKTFPIWEEAATPTDNRGMAAGAPEVGEDGKIKGIRKEHGILLPMEPGSTRANFLKQDGTVAKKTVAKTVHSGIVGYMNGNTRFPYCRTTAFTGNEFEKYKQCLPVMQVASEEFRRLMPERWAVQHEYWKRTHPAFRIENTVFTTVTCNFNFRTACHQDKGDLKEGFGVMTAMQKGRYKGGFTIFPKYRIAVDMRTSDILLADVHEWHSNSEMIGIPGTYKRISLVFYYREKIAACLSPEEERLKAIQNTEATYEKPTQVKLL